MWIERWLLNFKIIHEYMRAIVYDNEHSFVLPEHVRVYFFTCVIISTDKRTRALFLKYCIISIRLLLTIWVPSWQARSVCDDVVFITTRGRTKPGKHICLALGIKSMTGSRRIIEILNRFGHSISYHVMESMETELATFVTEKIY